MCVLVSKLCHCKAADHHGKALVIERYVVLNGLYRLDVSMYLCLWLHHRALELAVMSAAAAMDVYLAQLKQSRAQLGHQPSTDTGGKHMAGQTCRLQRFYPKDNAGQPRTMLVQDSVTTPGSYRRLGATQS